MIVENELAAPMVVYKDDPGEAWTRGLSYQQPLYKSSRDK